MAQRHPWRNKTTKEKYQRSPRKRKTKIKSLAQTMLRAPCEDDRTTRLMCRPCGDMVTRRCSADRNSKDSNKPKKPMQPHKLRVKGTALESRDQKQIELINQCSLQYQWGVRCQRASWLMAERSRSWTLHMGLRKKVRSLPVQVAKIKKSQPRRKIWSTRCLRQDICIINTFPACTIASDAVGTRTCLTGMAQKMSPITR